MDTKDFWAGSWGDEYLKRNRVDWRARIPFWKDVIDRTGARSVFELGCNAGWNLSAIKRAYPDTKIYGYDVNAKAAFIAKLSGDGEIVAGDNKYFSPINHMSTYSGGCFELSFTAGVLIHVSADELKQTMEHLADTSIDYVLAVEYESDHEEEVLYRGHEGKLWKRPYGKLYQELGLTLVDKWNADGFDNCTAWLLKK